MGYYSIVVWLRVLKKKKTKEKKEKEKKKNIGIRGLKDDLIGCSR